MARTVQPGCRRSPTVNVRSSCRPPAPAVKPPAEAGHRPQRKAQSAKRRAKSAAERQGAENTTGSAPATLPRTATTQRRHPEPRRRRGILAMGPGFASPITDPPLRHGIPRRAPVEMTGAPRLRLVLLRVAQGTHVIVRRFHIGGLPRNDIAHVRRQFRLPSPSCIRPRPNLRRARTLRGWRGRPGW